MMEKKKKNLSRFIIPPSYFRKAGITPISIASRQPEIDVNKIADNQTLEKQDSEKTVDNNIAKFVKPEPPKIDLNSSTKRTSGLSLKSIRAKKEHQIKQMDVVVDEENLPTDQFSEEAFMEAWNAYISKIEADRQMNLLTILSLDMPKLDGATINLTFPNETNKVELERDSFEVLNFLRKKLNNFSINFNITVNEVLQKKYAYTPQEKYDKLVEKNPNLALLRQTFDLDI